MDPILATSGISWQLVVFCGLSLSVGWGIRGNFGHEYGAAIPGALAAIAAVLVSGRPDWLATLVAMVAGLIVAAGRGGIDIATSLVLHLSIGWFLSFLTLVVLLKLRMTPPRGDNWAGCLGLAAGLLIFCWRYDLYGLALASLITGFIGGIGFSLGQFLKLLNVRTGLQTNWHSVMEQTQGLFHGIAIAVSMGLLSVLAPQNSNALPMPAWTGTFATGFVLIGLTYLNHRKASRNWVENVACLPERPYGLPVAGWFVRSRGWIGWLELIYIAIGIAVFWLMQIHRSQPLAFIPETWLGKGQLLYLVFLWWVVNFNFALKIVEFSPRRLVTEGLVTFNAIVCTVLAASIALADPGYGPTMPLADANSGWIRDTILIGLAAATAFTLCHWGLTHALFGRHHIPFAFRHIRFGPDATTGEEVTESEKPWKSG